MNLRRQLLLVSVLTLVLPWAGCQFIRETETALREGQENMLEGTAQAIADSLSQFPAEFLDTGSDGVYRETQLYAHRLNTAPLIDGYSDDWNLDRVEWRTLRGVNDQTRYVLGENGPHVYLLLEVRDTDIIFAGPNDTSDADGIDVVSVDAAGRRLKFRFFAQAPGTLVGRLHTATDEGPDSRLQGHWVTTPFGYRVEMRIPKRLVPKHLGLDVWQATRSQRTVRSSSYGGEGQPGRLILSSPALFSAVYPYGQEDLRLIVTDPAGWRLATAGQIASSGRPTAPSASGWLKFAYDIVLEPGNETPFAEPSPSGREQHDYVVKALAGETGRDWFRSAVTGRAVVAVSKPVYSGSVQTGAVILQQGTDAILSLTNSALGRLLNLTLLATLVTVVGLLGYASWLSLRVRRLSAAAERAVDTDSLGIDLPSATARDEIGDLSRSFSSVLRQLKDYNEYLRTLASKLSHELRTPLGIVNSSLENLEHEPLTDAATKYTERARHGVVRLRKVLDAMSEVNRVEALMQNIDPEPFDLKATIEAALSGYSDAWNERIFTFSSHLDEAPAYGSPELIVQLLDKLVDNAVSFSERGTEIAVALTKNAGEYVLSVDNTGPPLPAKLRSQLFDSMVSVRADGAAEHLGLGLHIARIVADGHGGRITAANSDVGVTFSVRLPTS